MLYSQLVYLVQTDTTAGFLSQNSKALAGSKHRNQKQPFISCVDSFYTLKEFTRVPSLFKRRVRRSQKSTFIYPNDKAIRVVKDSLHVEFLQKLHWSYSSSANFTKKRFQMEYAKKKADIIVEDTRGFFEDTPSKIYKIYKTKLRRLR